MAESRVPWKPYNWLPEAVIYNKKYEIVTWEWLEENADIVVLLFTAKGIDKDGIIKRFYETYEYIKFVNLPIEVIYIPMDDSEEDMKLSYEDQANWFTLKFDDPLVSTLKFVYGITSIPNICVLKSDGTIVSSHGIMDLEKYGKNAVITWISTSSSTKNHRRMSKDTIMYGDKWRYLNVGHKSKHDYQRKFSIVPDETTENL